MAIDTSSEELQDQLEEQQSSGGYDSTQMQIDQMLSAGWPQAGGQQASAAQAPPPPSPYAQSAPQPTPLTPAAAPYQPPAQYAPAPTQALAGARVPYQYQARPTTPPPPLPAPAFMQPQQPPPGAVGVVTNIPGVDRAYQMSPEETAAGAGQAVTFEPKDESGFFATVGKGLLRGAAGLVPMIPEVASMMMQTVPGMGAARELVPDLAKAQDIAKNAVEQKAEDINQWVNENAPPTIKRFDDIKSAGDLATYAYERVAQMAPQALAYAAVPEAGAWGVLGAVYGYDKAMRETNGNPSAVAFSTVSNALLMGATPAFLASVGGKGFIRSIATMAPVNAALGVAGVASDQATTAIAQSKNVANFIDTMSNGDWKTYAEAAATGLVQGVLLGGVAGYLHPGEPAPFKGKPASEILKVVPGNPADADQQAALNQAINPSQPSTTSDTFRTVEQGNIQPPPPPPPGGGGGGPPTALDNTNTARAGMGMGPLSADQTGGAPPPPPPPGAPLVRGPADLAAQAATIEQARQQAAGTEGDVVPGAPAPAPPVMPTPSGLPALPPPGPGNRPEVIPAPDLSMQNLQPGQAPDVRVSAVPPGGPPEGVALPTPGVEPGARQGELPNVEPPPAQGELRPLPAETGAPAQPVLGEDPNQRALPLEDQPKLPAQTLGDKLQDHPNWLVEPDDQTPGQYVVKHGNDVLSVGSSPEEALAMAHQRAEAARRAAPAEALPTVGSEEGPTGAAGPEGAAEAAPAGEVATLEKPAEPVGKAGSWGEQGRRDAQAKVYDPPSNSSRGRAAYQLGWEDAADAAAWAARQGLPEPKPETAAEKAAAVSPKEAAAQAKAKGEPVGVALVTREQLRKKLGITPERGNVAVAEGTAPEFKTVEEGNVTPTKRPSRMAQQAKTEMAIRSGETGAARDIPGAVEGKRTAPTSDYKALYRSRAKEVAAGTNFVDQVMRELPPTGTRGPQRENFVKYLHDRLVEARDDNTIPDLQARQERARTPTAKGRIEDDIQFYKDLREHQAEIQQQIGEALEPRPEGAAALKSAEDELDAELARIKAAKDQTRNAPPSPERQVANRFQTPGVNDPVKAIYDRIEAKDAEGATRDTAGVSIHEVLDAIANNSRLGTAGLQQARVLATILKKMLPASTRVIGEDSAHLFGSDRPYSAAHYDPKGDVVVVRRSGAGDVDHVTMALHEAVHAATAHYIQDAERAQRMGRATPEQLRQLDALNAIHDEVGRIFNREGHTFSQDETANWLHALKDNHELTAVLLTDQHVQDTLARTTPSPEFQREMERLGYNKDERPNLWAAFRGFLRRAFGLTSSTDNVLGHAMRALGDVADAGARYRREPAILRGIQDARLRSAVELGGHVLNAPPLSERARDMVTEQVAKMRGDRAITLRRTLLNGDNVDAIYRGYGQLFHDPDTGGNSFADYRAATERGTAVSHAVRTGRGTEGEPSLLDRWQGIDASLSRLAPAQEKALAQLTNEVGYADASVGSSDPTANAHLTKAEDLQTLQGLQARWNELPDELKRLYKERQAFHETMYRNERAGQLDQAMRLAAPESTPEDRAAAQQQFYSRASTREFLANPDASPLAEAMGDSYQRSRKVVQMIGQLMQMSRVQGDYAPLRRYGDYVVKWGDRGSPGEYGVRFFESMVDAEKARAKLAADGEEPSQVFSKADRRGLQQVNPRELGALEQELLKNGRTAEDAAAVRDVFATMILKRMSDSQASRLGARREGVLGASEDLRRIDRSEFDNHAMHMAMLASRVDREEALTRMQARADELRSPLHGKPGENIQAQDVVDQMRKRLPTDNRSRGLSGATAGVIGRHASNFAFLNTLFRPARMPIELVGMHAMNQSMLGGTYGQAAALRATTRAQGDVGFGKSLRLGMNNVLNQMGGNLKKVNWENGAAIRDRMIANGVNPEVANKLYDRMVAAGIIDISHAQVAAEMGRPTSKWASAASLHDRIIGGMSQMDNAIETMARMTFAKSALDLELARNGGNLDAALDVAMEHARAVMPNWNTHNAPWLASTQGPLGALAKPLFQFRGFGLHAFGLMANLAREAYRGGDEGQRAIALKQLGGIIAYHALVGGAAIPLVEEIAKGLLGAVDFVQGRRQPRDMDRIIRTFLSDQLGPTAAMAITRGLPSLAGVDVGSNLSLNNLMMVPEFKDLSAGELMKTAALMFVPVSGQDATQLMTGFQQALRGNIAGGIRNMIPIRMVRDVATAYQWGQEGMTDARGRVVLPSSQISTGDLIAKGIGFRPTIDSNFQAGRAAITEYLNEEKDERTRIINNAVAKGLGAVGRDVAEFNRNYPANPIKYDTLLKAQQEARQSVGATYGMRVSPKQVADVRQQTRFLPQ